MTFKKFIMLIYCYLNHCLVDISKRSTTCANIEMKELALGRFLGSAAIEMHCALAGAYIAAIERVCYFGPVLEATDRILRGSTL